MSRKTLRPFNITRLLSHIQNRVGSKNPILWVSNSQKDYFYYVHVHNLFPHSIAQEPGKLYETTIESALDIYRSIDL